LAEASEDLLMSLFKNASELQYGDQQVILVRDDSAKERLLADRPSFRGKILTVREAKGLEFNDVLLLGFFTDSPLSVTDWRALGAYLKHLGTWENEGVPREAVSQISMDIY
jgi:superfamily I DNA/RNA helicase